MESRSPLAGKDPAEPAESTSSQELEKRIYSLTDEVVRLLGQVRGPARNVLKRSVVESIREVPADVPAEEAKSEPGNQNFGAFGLMVIVVGVLFMPIIPPMSIACLVIGFLILLLSFLAGVFSRAGSRSVERHVQTGATEPDEAPAHDTVNR